MRKVVFNDKAFPVGKGLKIGKAADNHIVLEAEKGIEDYHAKVAIVGPYVFLEDLDSDKGTELNGEKIRRTAVKKGDKIKIGSNQLLYDEDDQPEPSKKAASKKKPAAAPAAQQQKPKSTRKPVVQQASPAPQQPARSAPRASGLRRAGKSGTRIKLSGMGDMERSASGTRNPALTSQGRGSSTATPAVPPSAIGGRPGSSVRGTSAARDPRGSSSLNPALGSSSRTPIPTSNDFAAIEEAAKKQVDKAKKDAAQKPMRMTGAGIMGMIILLLAVVLVVFLTPYVKNWMREIDEERKRGKSVAAAKARLKDDEFKQRADLKLVMHKLRKAETVEEVHDILGEPNEEESGSVTLWKPDKGCYDYPGEDFMVYYVSDDGDKDNRTAREGAIVGIILFEVDGDDVTYRGPFRYAREDAPGLDLPKGEEKPRDAQVGDAEMTIDDTAPTPATPTPDERLPTGPTSEPADPTQVDPNDPAADTGAAPVEGPGGETDPNAPEKQEKPPDEQPPPNP